MPEDWRTDPVTIFSPDFPFAHDDWLRHPAGHGSLPAAAQGATVAVVGAGLAGLVTAYELMELGLRPVVYEPTRIGGRLRSHEFEGADGVIAELGGMRFPVSGRSFFRYVNRVGLASAPFPNPLTEAAFHSQGSAPGDCRRKQLSSHTLSTPTGPDT